MDTASTILVGIIVLFALVKVIGYLGRMGIKQIGPRELDQKKGIMLLDVRSDREYRLGHIPGAIHVPLSEVGTRVKKVKKDKEIVVYCRSGNQSIWAIKRLMGMGYTHLFNLKGGYGAWKRSH